MKLCLTMMEINLELGNFALLWRRRTIIAANQLDEETRHEQVDFPWAHKFVE